MTDANPNVPVPPQEPEVQSQIIANVPIEIPQPDPSKACWIKADRVKEHESGRTDLYMLHFMNGDTNLQSYGPVEAMMVAFLTVSLQNGATTIGVQR